MIDYVTINVARGALRDAIKEVREFHGNLSDAEGLTLLLIVADFEGPPYTNPNYPVHAPEFYERVRRRYG